MRRVIIDTNLWISALLKAPFRQRLEVVLFHPDVEVIISSTLLEELAEVARRPKFRRYFTVEQAVEFIEVLEAIATRIEPTSQVRASPDPDDDFLLALALDSNADALLTGNKQDLLNLQTFGMTRILTLSQFLTELV